MDHAGFDKSRLSQQYPSLSKDGIFTTLIFFLAEFKKKRDFYSRSIYGRKEALKWLRFIRHPALDVSNRLSKP
jgi:hypothetical protein